jgi:outer membrane protein assembly factor BamB
VTPPVALRTGDLLATLDVHSVNNLRRNAVAMGLAFLLCARDTAAGPIRFRWLVDLGAESLAAAPRTAGASERSIAISVPGAAYLFSVGPDGSLQKQKRLAADASAPYGVAAPDAGMALASKEGSVGLWAFSPGGDASLRWRRELGERATSVGWDGGDLVLVATWRNRLVALSATDGQSLWTADIAGRADAPAVVEGRDVFVATKAKTLFRIDAATGGIRWKVGLPGLVLHPPVLLGEKPRLVLCGTWDGQLLAYDALTGQVRWSVALPAKLAGAPVAGPGLVAAITAEGTVHSYDLAGRPRWVQPGSSEGAATLLLQSPGGSAPRLLVVSKVLVALDLATGERVADYPKAAVEQLRRRFADAMLEGVKTYSEGEKQALLEREAFDVSGAPFGPGHLVGSRVAFGTEDGWAYLFDASSLRPLARYRAGQPCSGGPVLAGGRVLAVAGEEIFGLDPSTGRVLWKKILGADAGRITGESTLGIVAGGRVNALDPKDGVLQWSLRGRFRSVAPPAPTAPGESSTGPWLADDGEGNLRAIWPSGRLGGEALPAGGDLLPVEATSARSWVAATREGKVSSVTWEEEPGTSGGRLVEAWQRTFDERLSEVRFAGGRLVVRSEAGSLVGFDESHQEIWRLRLSSEDRFELVPQAASLLVLGVAELRVHDWVSGEPRFQWKVGSPAVGANIRGRALLWLDRSGAAHAVDMQDGRLLDTTDLGGPLAAAAPTGDGFLVITAAGEAGLVEAAGEPVAAAGREPDLVERGEGK